ncbi:MAG TPA: hypothetical protein VK596_06840, partial [Edaphobacter sp.]|nr:hypothetical protein [Edaphobacter sp.]
MKTERIASKKLRVATTLALAILFTTLSASAADAPKSQLIPREIQSKNFANSKIGIDPVRKLLVYLPPDYDSSTQRYPVIYFFPSPFDSSFRAIFDKSGAQSILDHAI